MNNRLTAIVLLCALGTPSCFLARSRINQPIDQSAYQRLEPMVSTQEDVLRELGAPAAVVQLGEKSAWRYDHTLSKVATFWPLFVVLANTEDQQDRVWAFFNGTGLMTHLGGTFEAETAEYKLPWSD
jgi:hypothetical protein